MFCKVRIPKAWGKFVNFKEIVQIKDNWIQGDDANSSIKHILIMSNGQFIEKREWK